MKKSKSLIIFNRILSITVTALYVIPFILVIILIVNINSNNTNSSHAAEHNRGITTALQTLQQNRDKQ